MIIDLFAEWRVAARTATTAERAVSNAHRRFFQGVGEPPTIESIAEAKRKRALADDLFIVAMGSYPAKRKPSFDRAQWRPGDRVMLCRSGCVHAARPSGARP